MDSDWPLFSAPLWAVPDKARVPEAQGAPRAGCSERGNGLGSFWKRCHRHNWSSKTLGKSLRVLFYRKEDKDGARESKQMSLMTTLGASSGVCLWASSTGCLLFFVFFASSSEALYHSPPALPPYRRKGPRAPAGFLKLPFFLPPSPPLLALVSLVPVLNENRIAPLKERIGDAMQ